MADTPKLDAGPAARPTRYRRPADGVACEFDVDIEPSLTTTKVMDLKSYSRWFDYSRTRDAMLAATDTSWAPWFIADKKRGGLNIFSHLRSHDPYQKIERPEVKLPRRQAGRGYFEPDLPLLHILEPFLTTAENSTMKTTR